jgi:hypothetical protein
MGICKRFLIFLVFVFFPASVSALDLHKTLSFSPTLTHVYQYGFFHNSDVKDSGRNAFTADLEFDFHPTENDQVQTVVSFAHENGLNLITPVSLSPLGDDLKGGLQDINHRNRDFLLIAWYKHTFRFGEKHSLGMTGGIIDATEYLDDNAFANDENSQFMNEVFVNNSLANLPSYDIGGAAELELFERWSLRGVYMNSENDREKTYNYYGGQLGCRLDLLGEGNYRVYGYITDKRFLDSSEVKEESLWGFGASLDQKLGEILGVFARFGWQDDEAAVNHDLFYSGGLNINGKLWKRADDEIGFGYAALEGAKTSSINRTHALEGYIKIQVYRYFDISLDVQYIKDTIKDDRNPSAFIIGSRVNISF